MITASELANGFSSLWQEITPTSERVVRRLNLSVERYFDPLEGKSNPRRHALVNEIGFELSRELSLTRWPPRRFSPNKVPDRTYATVRDRLIDFARVVEEDLVPLSADEEVEALSLCYRIIHFFSSVAQSQPDFFPNFSGCGFLYPSQGDIRTETTLFEVKSGERQFRSPDLRQLLVYCATNFVAEGRLIQEIGLLNPRMGTYFVWDLRAVCFELGGFSPQELFEKIIYHVSSGSISR